MLSGDGTLAIRVCNQKSGWNVMNFEGNRSERARLEMMINIGDDNGWLEERSDMKGGEKGEKGRGRVCVCECECKCEV